MKFYKYILVVCTYGAAEDLKKFIKSVVELNIDAKIIVANSFCNDDTLKALREIAENNNCDFLNLPNKGYGHSLNEGIVYATSKYDYDYIAISNADILVKKIDTNRAPEEAFVLAPEIKTLTGKRQNPFYVHPYFKLFKLGKWIKEHTFIKRVYTVMIVAKVERVLFNLLYAKKVNTFKRIYAAHGAFILFSRATIKEIVRPFEEDIFLYCEENFLGYKLLKKGIPLYYSPSVSVLHTEDGSKRFYKHTINDETKKSIKKYYKLIERE